MPAFTETFIAALHRLEAHREVEAMVRLFADDASVSNPLVSHIEGGPEAARAFWLHYRDAFDEIQSDFRAVTEKDGMAFLEWRSRGSVDGERFELGGVSVLEETDGRISAFRTYFDTAQIPRVKIAGAHGATPAPAASKTSATGPAGGESDLDTAQREAAEQRAEGGYS